MSTPPSSVPTRHSDSIHNILLTLPRTSSHLLTQILNLPAQPSIHRHPSDGYFFLGPTVQRFSHHLAGKPLPQWTTDERDSVRDAFQSSYEQLDSFLTTVSTHQKSSFFKVHINWLIEPVSETKHLHSLPDSSLESPWTVETSTTQSPDVPKSPQNETALPDDVLKRLKPTFLIRHPALVFPSLLRTSIDNEGLDVVLSSEATQKWETTFHWSKTLYQFYDTHIPASDRATRTPGITYPIILDADDILNPELVRTYAAAISLAPELVRYSWKQASADEIEKLSAHERRMKDTLLASEGIVGGKTAVGLVVEEEVGRWREEFGDVLGARLEGWVRGAMEDYEWLLERRLKI